MHTVPPRTVTEHLIHYVEHLSGIEEGTRRRYRNMVRTIIGPAFRGILIADLTREHVVNWVNAQTVAPKTVANRHGLLSGALAQAVQDGLIPANPTTCSDEAPRFRRLAWWSDGRSWCWT